MRKALLVSVALHLVVLAGGRSSRAQRGDSTAPKQFRYAGRRIDRKSVV